MNDQRITDFVENLFKEVKQSQKVIEQKEELSANMTERIKDYMEKGHSFDQAFDMARDDFGDAAELTAGFEEEEPRHNSPEDKPRKHWHEPRPWIKHSKKPKREYYTNSRLIAISPFIYLALGFGFGWWAWAWAIIPVAAILFGGQVSWGNRMVALSPFVYVVLFGFAFGWWAWGWMIIPAAAILFGGSEF